MRLPSCITAALLTIIAAPALACVPPLPGEVEPPAPTEEARAKAIFRGSSEIAYGVLVSGAESSGPWRFRVVHRYKGALKPGAVIEVRSSHGFDPPPCFGMIAPPPLMKGAYGVIAYTGTPELAFVSDARLRIMFARGWIRSAQRVGTGSPPSATPE